MEVLLNLILEKSNGNRGFIFSVNGPPGTGKTTLLKDVFANIIYEKVKFLSETKDIFTKIQYGEGQEDYYYSIHQDMKNYRILVTSNNNTAVENISKDLPKDKALFKEGYRFFGFNEKEKSWGKISAAMGKRDNITTYFQTAEQELSDLCHRNSHTTHSIDTLEKQIIKMISNVVVNHQTDDIDDEAWQTSQEQFVNIDGEEPKDRMSCERSMLFTATIDTYCSFLTEHKEFIEQNKKAAQTYFLEGKVLGQEKDSFIQAMFDTVFLLTPIISSTFASVPRFLKDLNSEDIGWLFIDEAGQATPQSAIGAIWRSKNVVVVGDPLQIPPVVTLGDNQLKLLAKESVGITEEDDFFYYLTRNVVSVQEFADLNNRYGGEMEDAKNNKKWLGSPLRVHRRCVSPMFEICNETTYQNKMLHKTEADELVEHPIYLSQWIDIGGKSAGAGNHYIREQGQKAMEIAKTFCLNNPGEKCYIISPFVSVVNSLRLSRPKEEEYKHIDIGTVHTFQGKEAPLVIFVLGVDDQTNGPLKWASSTPNLLNVAASRAKSYFVVIGNSKSWGNLEYFNVAHNYLSKEAVVELK